MRKGWEYKRLDECANIEYGTRVVQKKDSGTLYPVYGGGGETFRMDKFNREDCLIVARFAMSRRCVRFVNGKFFLNDSGLSVKAGDKLYQSYLNYNIISLNDDIYHLGKGAAQRNLDVKSFKKLTIAIPPQSTQLAIVSELDKINELIRLKKEQLKDFDNLAQSLFYEMFGDPVENEKGWEVKKLGEVYKMKSGDSLSTKSFEEGDIPVYGGNGISGYHNKYNKDGSYIIIGRVGVYCGNVRIVKGRFWLTDNAFELLYDNSSQNEVFVCSLLTHLNLRQYANAAAQPVISNNTLKHVSIPLPPLPLQHFFAHRIDQIEHQKAEVQKAITDLETLLASRMQYWFE